MTAIVNEAITISMALNDAAPNVGSSNLRAYRTAEGSDE
jgi:hypothetical protein